MGLIRKFSRIENYELILIILYKTFQNVVNRFRRTELICNNYKNINGDIKKIYTIKNENRGKLLINEAYSRNVEQVYASKLVDYNVIIDCGANYGQFILEFLKEK